MEGDCYLLDVVASNTVSVIRTATSAVRLLLTHQRTIPWKKNALVIGDDAVQDRLIGYRCIYIIVIGGGRRTRKQLIGYAQQAHLAVAEGAAKEELIGHRCNGKRDDLPRR